MESQSEKIILVADYGRSGQGWLSYMLCYILNARFIEPYDFLKGRKYSKSDYVFNLTQGNLPDREKTCYSMVVKTHEFPAPDFNLTDKVIFLTRDPRDVAVSAYYMHLFYEKKYRKLRSFLGRIVSLIRSIRIINYIRTAKGWKKYFQKWQEVPYYFVRYEDLLLKTKETLNGILDYLGVSVKENIIEEAVNKFSFEKITGRKKGEEDPNNPEFRKGIIGDYKNHFSKSELIIFKLICGKEAKKAGYNL